MSQTHSKRPTFSINGMQSLIITRKYTVACSTLCPITKSKHGRSTKNSLPLENVSRKPKAEKRGKCELNKNNPVRLDLSVQSAEENFSKKLGRRNIPLEMVLKSTSMVERTLRGRRRNGLNRI